VLKQFIIFGIFEDTTNFSRTNMPELGISYRAVGRAVSSVMLSPRMS